MKVFIFPSISPKDSGEGGIRRVIEAQYKWLPEFGIDLIDRADKADIIAVHADEFKTDRPLAFHCHGLYWAEFDWMDWCHVANAKIIRMMKRAQAVSAPSQWVRNSLARGMLLDPTVLYHGINIGEWEPASNTGYVFWGKNRVDPICTPEPVLKLAALCPKVGFLSTFGNTNLENVTVTGRVNHEQSKAFLSHAAVYLATTLETGGITILESYAAGVPVVGFRWGANTELVVEGETGFLVEPGDYPALRDALYVCMAQRDTLGNNARIFVQENFQWRDRIEDYLLFYQRALEGTKRRGPTISVIVTAYNLEKYLPACLDSLLAQDFKDWECIVVDDASPDNCGKIADDYAKKDARFKVIHNAQNAYLAEARNIGARNSSGKYILPLDADDEASPGALRILAESLDKNPDTDITTGRFQLINPDGTRWISTWPPKEPSFNEQIKQRNQVPYASMYRRWVWERTGGYRRRWKTAEDAEFWTRAMSYGATPAHVTDAPTLTYNLRKDSMSHVNQSVDWTAWFPWAKFPEFTPFGASGKPPNSLPARPVLSYHPPLVSVIIPVGPGHEIYLQDTLDSLVAQTFQQWEVIVINDTGKQWLDAAECLTDKASVFLAGYPFATILDYSEEKRGVAGARNRGIANARGAYFALLDADDYAQSLWAELLYKAIKEYGGWCYTDWLDQNGEYKEAEDFDFQRAIRKMPGPSTGIYSKAEWEKAGGFDESGLLWEDWSFQLSLMEIGSCGVRIKYPGFTYRYNAGARREQAYANQDKALAEIRKKHKKLYAECT